MTEFRFKDGDDAMLGLRDAILEDGITVSPRGFPTKELSHVTLIIQDPAQAVPLNVGRKINYKIGATETAHLLGGISSLEQLDLASNGRFSQFANDGLLMGAYGPRTYHQFPNVLMKLVEDPNTRQAIVTVFRDDDCGAYADVPCTLSFEFHVRNDRLCMTTHMRSNDLWLGAPYDWWMFTRLQLTVADSLGLDPGEYTHLVDSLHIYERDVESIKQLEHDGQLRPQPPAPLRPQRIRQVSPSSVARRWFEASRIARMVCLPDMYPKGRAYVGAFNDFISWCSDHVPKLGDQYWLCDAKGSVQACRYVKHNSQFENTRRCRTCCSSSLTYATTSSGGSYNQRKLLRFLGVDKPFGQLCEEQDQRCAICKRIPPNGLVIDHCHTDLEFRGLLCSECNSGIGLLQDSPDYLRSAAEYLELYLGKRGSGEK